MTARKILVVDNEEDQLDMMGSLLARMGYQVVLAQDPDTALTLINKECFSLVITDLIMPGTDGMELCERIKSADPETAVYMFSGHVDLYEPEKIKRAGFDGYLQKPIDVTQLRQEIEKAFQRLDNLNH
jgi:DNA-binding NtrC family response regulator